MSTKPPAIFVLGEGPVARVISMVLAADLIPRRDDSRGWAWPENGRKELESVRLILAAGGECRESDWIRWHREARECPLARRVGVLLFGMGEEIAVRLSGRDIFGRLVATNSQFSSWPDDVAIVPKERSLRHLLTALDQLGCLYRSSWERELRAASCLGDLVLAIKERDSDLLHHFLSAASSTDWDAICFDGPGHTAHDRANRIRSWLKEVTAGVTPDWKEGLALFAPLCNE